MGSGDTMVATLALLFIFGFPVTGWIIFRLLAHRERMAMIERGLLPNAGSRQPVRFNAPVDQDLNGAAAQRQLRRGISVAFIGLALTIGLSFIGYEPSGGPFGSATIVPGAWLLGGLIPLFVGIAQIMTALLSGAHFGNAGGAARTEYLGSARPAEPPGPYNYRPGTTTELRPPPSPPDTTSRT